MFANIYDANLALEKQITVIEKGAGVTLQRDGWFDTVTEGVCGRTVQKMQNEAGVLTWDAFYS